MLSEVKSVHLGVQFQAIARSYGSTCPTTPLQDKSTIKSSSPYYYSPGPEKSSGVISPSPASGIGITYSPSAREGFWCGQALPPSPFRLRIRIRRLGASRMAFWKEGWISFRDSFRTNHTNCQFFNPKKSVPQKIFIDNREYQIYEIWRHTEDRVPRDCYS